MANEPANRERVIFWNIKAGAVTGAYMLRKGQYKLIYYVNFDPELFDLRADPEEVNNLANDNSYADILADLRNELRKICDPEAVDQQAHKEQREMVNALGGLEVVKNMGPKGATPPPDVS